MTGAPLVSVIIPAYNYAEWVGAAVDSALAQDHPGVEVIVVDDGSTDATPEVLASYGDAIRVIRRPNGGLNAATDTGIAAARGDFLTFLDADDTWRPDRVRLLAEALIANPAAGVVWGDMEVVDERGALLHPSFRAMKAIVPTRGRVLGRLLSYNFVSAGSLMVRASLRDLFHPIPEFAAWQDWWIVSQVTRVADVEPIDAVVNTYRQHAANMNLGTEGTREVGLWRAELPFRRWLLATADRSDVTPQDLVNGLVVYDRFVRGVAAHDGLDLTDAAPTSPDEAARAEGALAAGVRALAAGAVADAVPELVAAAALAPAATEPRLLLEDIAHTSITPPPARTTLAWTTLDEVRVRPELLAEWGRAYTARDDTTLVIGGVRDDGDEAALLALVERLGLAGDDAADLLAVPARHPAALTAALGRDLAGHATELIAAAQGADPESLLRERPRPPATDGVADGPPAAAGGRVLIVVDWFHPSVGGSERLAEMAGVALQAQGLDVEVATRPLAERTAGEHRGMTVHEIDGDPLASLAALVERGSYDGVLVFAAPTTWPVLATLQLPSPRPRLVVVPCINAENSAQLRANPAFLQRYRDLLAGADTVGYSSYGGEDARLCQDLGLSGVYVPNAVERVAPAGEFDRPTGSPLLLVVGNVWPEKNHAGLLQALRDHPGDWRLVHFGAASPSAPQLAGELARLAADDPRVTLGGPASPAVIAAAMGAADVLLLPSLAEATPLVLLEAMSHGLPWIATPTCGAAHDHAGGLILPLRGFGAGIDFLLDDPDAARALGEAGAAHWSAAYTWDVMGPRYARLLLGEPVSELGAPATALAATDAVRARFYDQRVAAPVSA